MTSLSYLIQLVLSIRILATPCGPAREEDAIEFVDADTGDANDGELNIASAVDSEETDWTDVEFDWRKWDVLKPSKG